MQVKLWRSNAFNSGQRCRHPCCRLEAQPCCRLEAQRQRGETTNSISKTCRAHDRNTIHAKSSCHQTFLSTNLLLILSVALFMPVLARSARPRPRSRHCCTKLLEWSVSLTAGRCDCWFLQLPSLETRPTAKQCVYKSRQASLKAHSGGATA